MSDVTGWRRLRWSGLALASLVVASPFLVRWAYRDWNADLVFAAAVPGVVLLGFVALTLWQVWRGFAPSFEPRALSVAASLTAVWVLGACLLGYFVLVLGLVVIPIAAAHLALAWVQPRDADKFLAVVLAESLAVLVIWFAGRADEFLGEALVAGGLIVGLVAVLALLRQRGDRRVVASA